MNFTKFYTSKTIEVIDKLSLERGNQIFVFLGQTELIDKTSLSDKVTDVDTFHLNGNDDLFDRG